MTTAPDTVSVLKVRNVLLVSVPAEPGDDTIDSLQEKILVAIERHGAMGVVLDISTVEVLDSFFARTIAETAEMVQLMGGRTVIAGMRAPVAITATQLGLTMSHTATALDVDRALDLLGERR